MFKPDNISDPVDIFKECQAIQAYLDSGEIAEGHGLVDRAHCLLGFLARSSKMLADSKWHMEELMNSEIMKILKQGIDLSPSTMNKLIDSACKDYNYLVNWCERLNRTITHQIEMTRTLISREKEEWRNNNIPQ